MEIIFKKSIRDLMGELTNTLNEFQEISRNYYKKIMEILKKKYCWKCPMRTNSNETLCREVESWIRLTEAMESGVREDFQDNNYSMDVMEIIAAEFLEKRINQPHKQEENIIVKLEYDAKPYAKKGDFIYLRTYPLKVKKDDLILIPRACPIATYWYIKTSKESTVPFKIFKVSRVFQKRGYRYIQTEEGLEIPLVYLIGVVKNIIGQDLSLQSWE